MRGVPRAVGVVMALALAGCAEDPAADPTSPPAPAESASTADGTPAADGSGSPAPVWWDADGLHRGDLVEPTAVPLSAVEGMIGGAATRHLALVRTGALYRDHRDGRVWFHPWGGSPRVVGRSTAAGPGGDPQGDTAAWFDGDELVVYDTVRHEVLSRTREPAGVSDRAEYVEHVGHGNGWVHVSPTQVVWRYGGDASYAVARRDLVAGTSQSPWQPVPSSGAAMRFVDLTSHTAAWVGGREHAGFGTFAFDSDETEGTTVIDAVLEYPGRLSPDGWWLLTGELDDGGHGVAFSDLRSGRTWKPFDEATYAFFSWAYGDVAVMRTQRQVADGPWVLTSCTASTRSCVELPTAGDVVVLPNP
jgi:hypothetical protein